MNVTQTLRDAANELAQTSDTARLDAELLMAEALEMSRSDMLLKGHELAVPPRFQRLLECRLRHEPIAYILGHQEFYGRDFLVTPDVLIPRADSETIVDLALEHCAGDSRILDLGTGSGVLLLTLLAEKRATQGVGIDASLAAMAVAAANAARLGVADQAHILHRSWNEDKWAEGLGIFDLIIANPPYVERNAILGPSVRDYEPAQALFAGVDGLEDYRTIIPQLRGLMKDSAFVVLEIGHQQDRAVAKIAEEAGFETELHRDLAHRPRAMLLR